ncbi:DUF429 domain-containing protein [soil metagenome]
MITAGVDLATEPVATALAVIEWSTHGATLVSLDLGVDDAWILHTAASVDKLGIDCPLGWPDDFVRFVTAHHSGHVTAPQDIAGLAWRRQLAYRETDRTVHQRTGLTPLSVAADRIGLTAMRAAGLLARLAEQGRPVDRTGLGILVEVYPAASLKCWRLTSRGYKGTKNRDQLAALVAATRRAAPWLHLGEHTALCAASDDAFDAVIAALTGRAAALSQVTPPADQPTTAIAQKEGWIALPNESLGSLLTG